VRKDNPYYRLNVLKRFKFIAPKAMRYQSKAAGYNNHHQTNLDFSAKNTPTPNINSNKPILNF
jgi:hypothetical protein